MSVPNNNSFILEDGIRYIIRDGPLPSQTWRVGGTVNFTVMRTGHGAKPVTVSVRLTNVKHFPVKNEYEFYGVVVGSGQATIGLYRPFGRAHGTIRRAPGA